MTETEYLNRIREIIAVRFGDEMQLLPVDTIDLDTDLTEDLPITSLDMIDLILACETAFNVKLDMDDAKNTHTIRDLISWIVGNAQSH